MPLLSRAKRRVGAVLGSAAMHADAKQTEVCTYLSAILLGGLLLNMFFGFWWADPLAALLMTPIIAKEGIEGLLRQRLRRLFALGQPQVSEKAPNPSVRWQ